MGGLATALSSDSTLQTATKAPRLKSEANMNKHRCVSTAVPDNALRVSPQRTPTRENNRPAHCQQRTALVETPTDHKITETVPSLPLWGMLLLVTLVLIVCPNRRTKRSARPTLPTHGS